MTQQERSDSVSLSGLVQPGDWPWRHWRQVRAKVPALRLNDEVLSWSALCTRVDQLACGFAAQAWKRAMVFCFARGIIRALCWPGSRCCNVGRGFYL